MRSPGGENLLKLQLVVSTNWALPILFVKAIRSHQANLQIRSKSRRMRTAADEGKKMLPQVEGCAVRQVWTNDLDADRQAVGETADRDHRHREVARTGWRHPRHQAPVRPLFLADPCHSCRHRFG